MSVPGSGAARISLDKLTVGGHPLADDEDTAFAYQFLAGVAYQMSPQLYLDLDYRYFATLRPEFKDATGTEFKSEYVTHNVTFGVRLDF